MASYEKRKDEYPPCLWLHGILPVGIQMTDALLSLLQTFLATVHHLRKARLTVHSENTTRYPWRRAGEQEIIRDHVRFHFHCSRCPPRWWPFETALLFGLMEWMSTLRWVTGQVSDLELAIDVRAYTGYYTAPNCKDGSPPLLANCATGLRRMIKLILANPGGAVNIPRWVFPAKQVPRVDSLKGVIGLRAATGYDARPMFASEFTADILEKQLPAVIPLPQWKKFFKVEYPDACGRKWVKYNNIMIKHKLGNNPAWTKKLAKIAMQPDAIPPAPPVRSSSAPAVRPNDVAPRTIPPRPQQRSRSAGTSSVAPSHRKNTGVK